MQPLDIFKAYDVRGVYPKQINRKVAYALGIAFSIFAYKKFRVKTIPIARDIRKSSILLSNAFKQGVIAQGSRPVDLGITTTPMFYYLIAKHFKAGVIVTPSHLPKQYNGFKFSGPRAVNIGIDSGLREIKEIYNKVFETVTKKSLISYKHDTRHHMKYKHKITKDVITADLHTNYIKDYHNYFIRRYHKQFFVRRLSNIESSNKSSAKKLRIVVDFGNGSGFLDMPILNRYFDVTPINKKPDGNFPARGPNPLIKGVLKKLQRIVKLKKADFGVAFDGDADRAVFVDDKGEIVPPDFLGGLLALNMLNKVRSKNRNIIVDIRASKAVFEEIEKAKARPILSRSGREFIGKNMDKYNALFGFELSGHYFFKTFWGRDNALLSILEVGKMLVDHNFQKLSRLSKRFKKYARCSDISIMVRNRDRVLSSVRKHFSDANKILLLDGVCVVYDDFWFVLRKSNTEPVLRLSIEAINNSILNKAKRRLFNIIDGRLLYSHF